MLRNVCWLFVVAVLLASPARAEEATTAEPKSTAELIKQLDAENFVDRQAASKELTARGKDALPALMEAAQGESAEAASRALDILRTHHADGDGEVKQAATAALQKIAVGDGSPARRASEILTPKPAVPAEGANRPRIAIRPGARIEGGALRIVVAAGEARAAGGRNRISMKETDGVKQIEAEEGGRITRIDDDPAKGIKVQVTEKKDGKAETKEYAAKNADELKKNHPEAYKLYEQYAQGAIHIEGLRLDVAPGVVPPPRLRREPPAIIRDPRAVTDSLDKAQQKLDDVAAALKKLEKGDEVEAALESIEAARKELDEIKAQFPMR